MDTNKANKAIEPNNWGIDVWNMLNNMFYKNTVNEKNNNVDFYKSRKDNKYGEIEKH